MYTWFLLFAMSSFAAASVPAGNPFLYVNVTSANYNQSIVAVDIAAWLQANNLASFGSAINESAIEFFDVTSSGDVNLFNVTVYTQGITNVQQYFALQALSTALLSGSVLGAQYTVTFASLFENPATTVYVYLSPMGDVYEYERSPIYTISLSASPRVNTNITIYFAPTANSVIFNTTHVVIPWPQMSANFYATAGGVATTCGLAFVAWGGSDISSRYTLSSSFIDNYMTVLPLATVSVSAPPESSRVYTNQSSPAFYLSVPTHDTATFDLVVTPIITPSGASATPTNVTVTAINTPESFYVSGLPGVYTVSYLIAPPYVLANGNTVGANNPDFQAITYTSLLVIQPTMNASSASIPDAYLVNPVMSASYGGAYSVSIPFHIQQTPVTGTVLTVTPSGSSTIEVTPPYINFYPGGVINAAFMYRAYTIGIQTITFTLSGSAMGDYYMNPPTREWIVHGPNPRCFLETSNTTCFATAGCNWNADRSYCSNKTLPIALPTIPLLYDGQPSVPLVFTLPTPVPSSLTITFYAASRLTFTPTSLTLPEGSTGANFTITGVLLTTDTGAVTAPFQLLLSGPSANVYDQQATAATVRPKVVCTITPPVNAFYVQTLSNEFVIACNTPTETQVIFTPVPSLQDIVIVPQELNASYPNSVVFTPGVSIGYFYANSTASVEGLSTLSITISGYDAERYAPIATSEFRVIPSGTLNPPPSFYMTAFTTSEELHIDLSSAPPLPLNVTIQVFQNVTNIPAECNVTISPNVITYNQTNRGLINVTANATGWYYMNFTMTGPNVPNYIVPTMQVLFEVQDPLDGPAFTAWLQPGHMPSRTKCRISVGYESTRIDGQAPVALSNEFCTVYPNINVFPNETYPCETQASKLQCQAVIQNLGHACAWNGNECVFLSALEGQIASYAYGSGFSVFLTYSGTVWTMGSNEYGQLGQDNTTLGMVTLPETIAVVTAGIATVMVLSDYGNVYTWGANENGQLGIGTNTMHLQTPSMVTFPTGENITCISSGALHNAALAQSGRLYMWGSNQYGQLGTQAQYRGYATTPIQLGIDTFGGNPVIAVTLGEYHSMCATSSSAYTWGINDMGQLGRPGYDSYTPAPPVLWVPSPYSTPPTYASYLLGSDC